MYTIVAKPTSTTYTQTNKSIANYPLVGSAIIGTSNVGVNTNLYTTVTRPTGQSTWNNMAYIWNSPLLGTWDLPLKTGYTLVSKPV
jgi:hypothetical protein